VGATADSVGKTFGFVKTRRILQGLSGVLPAGILWYLSNPVSDVAADGWLSPAFLFGAAQTFSALSLGAVSVSHLEVAPKNSGTVYALGNAMSSLSALFTVKLFGDLLESGGGSDFELPLRLVAVITVIGALIYATSIECEPDILV